MQLRNSLPEIPSGWVHQHSSISVFVLHRMNINYYNSKVISYGIIYNKWNGIWSCWLNVAHFLETLFHCPQCCSLFPAVREQKESFRYSSEYQTLPFRNPAWYLLYYSNIFLTMWITSTPCFRLWYILWNRRWKATTTWYVRELFLYHCKIIIVCTVMIIKSSHSFSCVSQ